MFDYSHLLSSTLFSLRSSPFASSLARSHLLLRTRIYPPTYLLWLSIVAQLSFSHLAINLWANIIAGLCSQFTFGQTSSQDFARDPPLGKHYRRTLLAIYAWPNPIAWLCPRSSSGQLNLSLTDPRSARVPLHPELRPFTLRNFLRAKDSCDWWSVD